MSANNSQPPTSIPALLQHIERPYDPHLIASVNDHDIKIAKIDGPFIWHAHPDTDELFHVLAGTLTLEMEGREAVVLHSRDVFVVPQGVRHRPTGEKADVIMVERVGTVNTGDETGSGRTVDVKDARGMRNA